jgi:hypothetical protein
MLLLVTGASGMGKSTVRTLVEPALAPAVECVELAHVLPLRGVPSLLWRQQATEAAVRRAVELERNGRHLLLAGDPVAAVEAVAAPSAAGLDSIGVCLLDASPQEQARRLEARGDDPALLHHHQAFADWMRLSAQDPLHLPQVVTTDGWDQMRWERLDRLAPAWHVTVLDTTAMTRAMVATAVLAWCRSTLNGDVRSMQVNE